MGHDLLDRHAKFSQGKKRRLGHSNAPSECVRRKVKPPPCRSPHSENETQTDQLASEAKA